MFIYSRTLHFKPCLGFLITLLNSNFSTQIPCVSRFVLFFLFLFLSFLFAPHYLNSLVWTNPSFFSFDTCILVILALLEFYVFFIASPALAGFLSSLRLSQVEGGEKSLLFRLQNKQILCYKQEIRKKV